MSNPQHVTISGAPEGFDVRGLLAELEAAGRGVHVARDD